MWLYVRTYRTELATHSDPLTSFSSVQMFTKSASPDHTLKASPTSLILLPCFNFQQALSKSYHSVMQGVLLARSCSPACTLHVYKAVIQVFSRTRSTPGSQYVSSAWAALQEALRPRAFHCLLQVLMACWEIRSCQASPLRRPV